MITLNNILNILLILAILLLVGVIWICFGDAHYQGTIKEQKIWTNGTTTTKPSSEEMLYKHYEAPEKLKKYSLHHA